MYCILYICQSTSYKNQGILQRISKNSLPSFANIRILSFANIRILSFANIWFLSFANFIILSFANIRILSFSNIRILNFAKIRILNFAHAEIKGWRWAGMKLLFHKTKTSLQNWSVCFCVIFLWTFLFCIPYLRILRNISLLKDIIFYVNPSKPCAVYNVKHSMENQQQRLH